ncbi:MAG: phosphohistidine phosphatase SixA [Acidobacteria bacterium]|nr:phosphohistidine phosphatase SixA [Acidobacteriota bacterium]
MMSPCALYLIRHGIAADPSSALPDDPARPLTDEGTQRLRVQFKALRRLGVEIEHILTSPLVRAIQTAALLKEAFRNAPAVSVVDALRPGGRFDGLMAELARLPNVHGVALVGHEPSMGMVAARLLGARDAIPFKKGAVCRIDVATLPPTEPGQLQWFLPPRVLRGLVG